MTSGTLTHTPSPATGHTQLRLRLKPQAPATGYVDGAWWPRSRDLADELPALAEVLAVRLGRIERVAYALSAWDATPRRLEVDGYRVRAEGFTYQDRNIIHVTGSNRGRISLLVIPPEMNETAGHDALMTAAHRGNADRPEDILGTVRLPAPRQAHEYSAQRWESDGGLVHQLD
ncbi:DUF5994 family protein [Actinophytocola sp.]|uniref:DUF5994 family protein n=1 Tax=Actinophytocola sp. TaxID=1872138 RepID=UPI002ED000BF